MQFHFILPLLVFGVCFADDEIGDIPTDVDDDNDVGSAVGTVAERQIWWDSLLESRKTHLTNLFDLEWFNKEIDDQTRVAYAYMAQGVYDFLDSGVDSNPDDSYIGFAPLLLRASFHGSGSFTHATGTGGSNGGTIFNHAELADDQNGCISGATTELYDLFHGHSMVPLSDSLVIAGVVALDTMNFPRMDLIPVTGGRDTIQNVAHRDRLPEVDDDPTARFTQQYDLTLSQTVSLIGGAHNFGSAHAKCSKYQGQWTASPLDWFGPEGSDPTFFPDLLRDDWRWYKVCSFENNTVDYISMDDPFANGAIPEDSEDEDEEDEDEDEDGDSDSEGEEMCLVMKSEEPIDCESQAMRGCDFEDGLYSNNNSPCNVNLLQMRLKSDFFLKANAKMLPFAQGFAEDPDLLAEEFAVAYHKILHNGLNRCGISGHGCSEGHICKKVGDDASLASCVHESYYDDAFVGNVEYDDSYENGAIYITLLSIVLVFGATTTALVALLLKKVNSMATKQNSKESDSAMKFKLNETL